MSIQSSANSYSTVTNIRFGAVELKDTWWNVNEMVLPSISIPQIERNTRAGANIHMSPDTATYTELSVSITLDKEWKVYDEIYQYFLEGLNVDTGKFSHFKKFELWAEVVDGEDNVVKRFHFHSCRITDFGGLVITPNDGEDSLQTLDLQFSCMYFTVD